MFVAGLTLLAAVPLTQHTPGFDPTCGVDGYEELIGETGILVIEAKEPVLYDQLSGPWERACALLTFDINDAGLASDIKIVSYFPGLLVQRAAINAILDYKFLAEQRAIRAAIRFEFSADSP